MPYIDSKSRMDVMTFGPMKKSGELNYMLTCKCLEYLKTMGKSYGTMNEIIGALDCAKMEFYRRVVVPYEQEKCKENGDVYDD